MGDLVAGEPALRIETVVSLPLGLVSLLSLLHRARPASGLDPWLIAARGRLPESLRDEIGLLHGFSGRMLYYPEEPVMRFQPLRPDRRDATFEELLTFMEGIPADDYCAMVAHALERVNADLERRWRPPVDSHDWARALGPALTTARLDDALALIADPAALKRRTIAMYEAVWEHLYKEAYEAELPVLREAARRGAEYGERGFAEAYVTLTGQRIPDVLDRPPPSITRIAFCPSTHLGGFVSYIAYEPDLIVYFAAAQFVDRCQVREPAVAPASGGPPALESQADLLDAARALADPTRLRMLDLLLDGELYAQEIVGRLGIVQSAASRHLAQLQRAGLVSVEARRGSKYYAVNPARLESIAATLAERGAKARRQSR
jgi:DNA-binding transcriptional ArsR family regulator